MDYPTKKQILENSPKFNEQDWNKIKEIIKTWKTAIYGTWRTYHNHKKTYQTAVLIDRIQQFIKNDAKINMFSDRYHYNPKDNTINLIADKPSIISSLHELGHAIYGPSELEACVFSVHLFKECFQGDYNKLVWQGHMLKLPTRKE